MFKIGSRLSTEPLIQRLSRAISTRVQPQARIDRLKEGNNSKVHSRLSKAHTLLSNKTSKFKYTTSKCLDLYLQEDAYLIEDILSSLKINRSFFNFLIDKFSTSSSIRALILFDLKRLWDNGHYDLIIAALSQFPQASKYQAPLKHKKSADKQLLTANRLVTFAALSGEPLIGASYALEFRKSSMTIQFDAFSVLIQCLTSYQGQQKQYYNHSVLKIVEEFPHDMFTMEDIPRIIKFSLVGAVDGYAANILFYKLKHKIPSDGIDSEFFSTVRLLIINNISNGHHQRAFKIYQHFTDNAIRYDTTILINLLQSLDFQSAMELIRSLDLNLLTTEALNAVLVCLGQGPTNKRMKEVMDLLKPPLRRSSLSALLNVFLRCGKEGETKKVLDTILKLPGGLTADDTAEIIKKLLREGEIIKAADLADRPGGEVSRKGCLSVLEYILLNNKVRDHENLIIRMATRSQCLPTEELNSVLPSLVTYVCSFRDIVLGRSFLDGIQKELSGHKLSNKTSELKKCGLPSEIAKIIEVTPRSVIESLYIILDLSLEHDDLEMIKWSVNELRQRGIIVTDILDYIKISKVSAFERYFAVLK